jgi:hypothetical protein
MNNVPVVGDIRAAECCQLCKFFSRKKPSDYGGASLKGYCSHPALSEPRPTRREAICDGFLKSGKEKITENKIKRESCQHEEFGLVLYQKSKCDVSYYVVKVPRYNLTCVWRCILCGLKSWQETKYFTISMMTKDKKINPDYDMVTSMWKELKIGKKLPECLEPKPEWSLG